MQRILDALLFLPLSFPVYADINPHAPTDTARVIDIEEAVVVTSPKETDKLRNQPLAFSLLSRTELENRNIRGLKGLSGNIPNLYIPDYGSRMTSAIYIRGIGSRMNTPSVGLYVDNIPYVNQTAFDFNFQEVDRIDVLRGPQGTLYGRNTMGGLIRIYTRDPLRRQGTFVTIGGSARNNGRSVSASTYQKWGRLGLSLSGFYEGNDGFFRNDSTGSRMDWNESGGGRLRMIYRANERLRLDWGASYEYSDQGGYPYRYVETVEEPETYPSLKGGITANRKSGYRRSLFNTGLAVSYEMPHCILTSVTGYQRLDDRMDMDQDFLYKDIYTLSQKQSANIFTEEITLKSPARKRWDWTTGIFASYEQIHTQAPVTFYREGMDMLNGQIAEYLPVISMNNPMTGKPTEVTMQMALTDPSMRIDGSFRTPSANLAIFHQSTFHRFLHKQLSLTIGMRLDYENQQLRYLSGGNTINYTFGMSMIPTAPLSCVPGLQGLLKNDYLQLLPKIALSYRLEKDLGNVYIAFSKGYRSGGYNVQNYSSLIQQLMRGQMMNGVRGHCNAVLQEAIDNASSPVLKNMFENIMKLVNEKIPTQPIPDVADAVMYRPEYSWNYEAGAHLNLLDGAMQANVAIFFMDTYDQQISRFTDDGLGRSLVNAGHSHSCGAEIELQGALLDNRLTLSGNYGYAHSVFRKYHDGKQDYRGNYVPMTPTHTAGLSADYRLPVQSRLVRNLTIGVNAIGAGRIYWTEQNNSYQNFYATLGAHILVDMGKIQLDIWGKNLTNTNYDTFCFESMNRRFAQQGTPVHVGANLYLSF